MKQLRPYQKESLEVTLNSFNNGQKKVVLSLCPNAGKTFTSSQIAIEFLKQHPTKEIVFLAEGQDVLRAQAYEDFENDIGDYYKVYKLESGKDFDEVKNTQPKVIITLPQTIDKLARTNKNFFSGCLVIVDEAHNRYLSEQVQRIIKNFGFEYELLMTGTPSKLILDNQKHQAENEGQNKYKFHIMSMVDLYKEMPEDITDKDRWFNKTSFYISQVSISKDINESYTDSDELQADFNFTKAETTKAVVGMFSEMLKAQIESFSNPQLENFIQSDKKGLRLTAQVIKTIKSGFMGRKIGKTMIAVHRQDVAKKVVDTLTELGFSALRSTQDENDFSQNIERFKTEEDITFLVVVQRGILGFNMPTLENVVDMSGSKNLDRIYQLYSRITRNHIDIPLKRFFKIAYKYEYDVTRYYTAAALSLVGSNIREYNGRNKLEMPVHVLSSTRDDSKDKEVQKRAKEDKRTTITTPKLLMDFEDEIFTAYNCLYMSSAYQVIGTTSLKNVLRVYGEWKGGDPEKNKREIIEFIEKNKRLPNSNGDEQEEKLYDNLIRYVSVTNSSYDEQFKIIIIEFKNKFNLFTKNEITTEKLSQDIEIIKQQKRVPFEVLTPLQKEIVEKRIYNGKTFKQIAEELNKQSANCHGFFKSAIKKLIKKIEEIEAFKALDKEWIKLRRVVNITGITKPNSLKEYKKTIGILREKEKEMKINKVEKNDYLSDKIKGLTLNEIAKKHNTNYAMVQRTIANIITKYKKQEEEIEKKVMEQQQLDELRVLAEYKANKDTKTLSHNCASYEEFEKWIQNNKKK